MAPNIAEDDVANNKITIPTIKEDITKEWLTLVIQPHVKGDLAVEEIHMAKGSEVGENYTSALTAIHVEAKLNSLPTDYHLIVKIMPEKQWLREMLAYLELFPTEVEYYNKLSPALVECQEDNVIHPPTPFCYFSAFDGQNGVVVLEDLKKLGYSMVDLIGGTPIDFEHAKVAMVAIGKYHALTFNMKLKTKGELKERFPQVFANKMPSFMIQPFTGGTEGVIALLESYDDKQEEIEYVKKATADLYQKALDSLDPVEPWATICHGDAWANNVMFKYEENSSGDKVPVSAMLVDLQIGRYSNPVTDIAYFLNMSCYPVVRKNHLRELLQVYHQEFHSVLKTLVGADEYKDLYSLDELHEMYYSKSYFFPFMWGLFATTSCLVGKPLFDTEKMQSDLSNVVEEKKQTILEHRSNEKVKEALFGILDEAMNNYKI